MRREVLFGTTFVLILMGCAAPGEPVKVSEHDPDDWPPVQRCGDRFPQQGKATAQVTSCTNVSPAIYTNLVTPAKADADAKAGLRCPSRCPTRRVSWQGNQNNCLNNTVTLKITGRYRCP